MQRDKNLIPLSHQHQHALALCVRIGKAFADGQVSPDVHPWEQEIVKQFDEEISFHFRAEETQLFPAAAQHEELIELVDELRIEHTLIRRNVEKARARKFTVTDLQVFTASLSEHVRKEERQLFEAMQKLFTTQELDRIGQAMQNYFVSSGMPGASCEIRSSGTITSE
jgi:iron-sulfur cluster repair protein YtfE (RIC family)